MFMKVTKLKERPTIDADWDKHPWRGVQPALIENHMGDRPEHFPRTQVKIAYDQQAIYVIFRVEDRYVRAVAADCQRSVYKDSCVEFFFAPDVNSPDKYFNLETNCGGTILFQFHRASGDEHIEASAAGSKSQLQCPGLSTPRSPTR